MFQFLGSESGLFEALSTLQQTTMETLLWAAACVYIRDVGGALKV